MSHRLIALLILVLSLSACSDYNEVVKSDDYTRKYELANTLFEDGSKPKLDRKGNIKFDSSGDPKVEANTLLRSVTLYEQVYERMPKTIEGENSYFRMGKAYYLAGDYYMGGYYLGVFSQRFQFSPKAEEALFLSAMCSVHNSPQYSLDQDETELAIYNLQEFLTKFPNSILVDSCNRIVDRLYDKLEIKDYEVVKLYSKTENYNAAITSSQSFMNDHPMSQYEEEVYEILVLNSILLAELSIESKKKERIEDTIERYRKFASRYPNSLALKAFIPKIESLEKELKNIGVAQK
jgi:outer membrane protein assembly factor BamD